MENKHPMFHVLDCGRAFADIQDREAELYTLQAGLTPEEEASKYAKYFYLGQAEPDRESLRAVERGADMDPGKAIMPEDIARVMNVPGNMEAETGFCVLPNGVGYASARILQTGLTDEKMQFFLDHYRPEGDLFYKTWCPGLHLRHYKDMAVEDVGWGMDQVRFTHPLSPADLGVAGGDPSLKDPACFALGGSNNLTWPLHLPDSEPMYSTQVTYTRAIPGGREMRVRFWLGLHFVGGRSELHLPGGKPIDPQYPRALANHCLWEFTTMTRNILLFWEDAQAGYFD